jgi:Family of unknown function (DUF6444)
MARGRKRWSRRDEPTRDTRDRQAQEIERLREENERLRKLLEEHTKRIADLERQLALKQQNSTITSKPPSSDGLAGRARERGRRLKSRRTAGGQPGHPGRHRELVPEDRLDAIVDLAPEACRHCARRHLGLLTRPSPAGRVRDNHFGEGNYEESEMRIRQLLAAAGSGGGIDREFRFIRSAWSRGGRRLAQLTVARNIRRLSESGELRVSWRCRGEHASPLRRSPSPAPQSMGACPAQLDSEDAIDASVPPHNGPEPA